jgi:hypothetical protein
VGITLISIFAAGKFGFVFFAVSGKRGKPACLPRGAVGPGGQPMRPITSRRARRAPEAMALAGVTVFHFFSFSFSRVGEQDRAFEYLIVYPSQSSPPDASNKAAAERAEQAAVQMKHANESQKMLDENLRRMKDTQAEYAARIVDRERDIEA